LLEKIAIAPLAGAQSMFKMKPLQCCGNAGGEDSQNVEMARAAGHRPLVEDREQAEHFALAVEQRRPQVAFDP
jgi:hypothetical protein